MPIITEDEKLAAKAAHSSAELIKHPTDPEAQIIARIPTIAEWTIFRGLQGSTEPAERIKASQMLVNTCTVFPAKKELQELLAGHPGYAEVFSGEIQEMAGIARGATREKL